MTETESKRRIGDILLELGFVSPDALAKACVEQDETGQPLGQILVEHGAITRLELASALAEQWADHASITPLPVPSAMPRLAPQPHDEDQYAARLQEAVASLAERVESATPRQSEPDGRVTELAERVEATVARTQRLEVTIATLAESLDGVTGGVEEAFGVLQSGMAGLALDLARIDTALAEIRAEPAVPAPDTSLLERHVEELRSAVQELAERPLADEEARGRADELAAEVARLADDGAVESVRESLGGIERRVEELAARSDVAAALEAQEALLDELGSAVAELRERPAGDPALDARLARIESQLAAAPTAVPAAADVQALAGRLEKTRDTQKEIACSLEALTSRLDEVARREPAEAVPTGELEEIRVRLGSLAADLEHVRETVPSARVAELAGELERLAAGDGLRSLETRLHELEGLLRDGYVSRDGLAGALDEVREELRPAPVEPDPRLDTLAADLAALRTELDRMEQLEARLGAGVVSPDELARALDELRDTLRPARVEPDPRLDTLAADLAALRTQLAELPAAPADDPTARAELSALAGRVEAFVTRDELGRALAAAAGGHGDTPGGPDPRVDHLVRELDVLRVEIARLEPATTPDPQLVAGLAALAGRVDDLAAERSERDALRNELDALRDVVGTAVSRGELDRALALARDELAAPPPVADPRVDELAAALDALRGDLVRVEQTPPPATVETIEYLAGRLGALEERPQPSAESPLDISHIEEAVTALMERLGRLEQLDARVDELAAAAASPSHPDPSPVAELRDELEARLAELGRKLEERLADGPAGPSEASEGVEGELERTRMAIERLSLHLGEHDRALAEMRGSRAMAQRLEELAARLDGMAAGALPASAAAPGGESSSSARGSLEPDIEMRAIMRRLEDLEEAASVGREKLMNRLERVASSIDWRLQRLEASDLAPEEGKS